MTARLGYPTVVLVRHAQSEWNREGRFTGWADPALTDVGRAEAARAGRRLAREGYRFDRAFSSMLRRARDTAGLVLRHSGNLGVTVREDWRLNERHYGALQGELRGAVGRLVGEDRVMRWRRGYYDQPPPIPEADPRHPARDPRWAGIGRAHLPNGETLAATRGRAAGFWATEVLPRVLAGERLLIVSHGNTLRALLMELDGMSVAQVEGFEIPTGVPLVYALSPKGEPIGWHYLGAERQVA